MAISKFLDPKNDIAFCRIFGSERNKDILIHFINDILELKGNNSVQEVTFLSPIQNPDIAAKKQSIVDVLCRDENGVQIIVEMQVSPQEGFEKRAQYYAAKAYSRQLNKGKSEGSRYIDLKSVIFIAISDTVIFKDKVLYKSDHIILDKDSHTHDLKDFSFTFLELPKFKITDIGLLTNLVEKWCYFFKHADETSEADLRRIIGSDEVIERAYEELNQFNWTEEELLIYEQELKRIMDNRAAEDYRLKEIRAVQQQFVEAQAKVMEAQAKVMEAQAKVMEAKAEGKAEGKAEAMQEVAKAMLMQHKPIDAIIAITKLSKQEIEAMRGAV